MSDTERYIEYDCSQCGYTFDPYMEGEECPQCGHNPAHPDIPFVDKINEFERGFQYPDEIHNDPEFWLEHLRQQVDEAEESAEEGDWEHMVVEIGDTILVAWRAMQIFGDESPEKILADRMDLNIDEKGYEQIMEKYIDWWTSIHGGGTRNWQSLHTDSD